MKKLFTSRFDIAGSSFRRALTLGMMNKLVPLGNFKHGPGLKPGLVLLFLHYFGKPLFWMIVRNEKFLNRLYMILRNRK